MRHQIDQELRADSCLARLLSEAYPEPRELVDTIAAFLKDLPAYDVKQAAITGTTPVAATVPLAAALGRTSPRRWWPRPAR